MDQSPQGFKLLTILIFADHIKLCSIDLSDLIRNRHRACFLKGILNSISISLSYIVCLSAFYEQEILSGLKKTLKNEPDSCCEVIQINSRFSESLDKIFLSRDLTV